MNQEELAKVKSRIEKKIVQVKEDIESLIALTQPIVPENSLGRLTRMDALNSKSVNESTLRQAKFTLGKLEYALKRIENNDPDFGKCSSCNEVIPLPRILLLPGSENCVHCAK